MEDGRNFWDYGFAWGGGISMEITIVHTSLDY